MKIVVASMGADPIHSGHCEYLNEARSLGDLLIVGINSDDWLVRKKGRPFMTFHERFVIVANLKPVDIVMGFDDSDGSANTLIQQVRTDFPHAEIIFANGGDRTAENIPEMGLDIENISFVFGVGGDYKKNSSSWILHNWKRNSDEKVQ